LDGVLYIQNSWNGKGGIVCNKILKFRKDDGVKKSRNDIDKALILSVVPYIHTKFEKDKPATHTAKLKIYFLRKAVLLGPENEPDPKTKKK
jgi:hypothetical protein